MAKLNTKRSLSAVLLIVGIAFSRLMFPVVAAPGQNNSPDSAIVFHGSKITFSGDRASQDEPDEIYMMNADGTGEQLVTVAALRDQLGDCLALYPRLSPNGKQVAFNCGPDIWLTDGTTVTRLAYNVRYPAWSPDGKQIAFATLTQPLQIFIISTDGSDLRGPVVNGNTPDWSPDGKRLLFARMQTVYVIDIDDPDNLIQLTNKDATGDFERHGFDVRPVWSPTGRRILFERAPVDNPRHTQVVVMNPDEPEPTSIPESITTPDEDLVPRLEEVQVTHATFPSWSPDGHWVLFQRLLCDPTLNHTNPQSFPNGSDLFAVDADGSHREIRLTFGACPGSPGPGEPFGTFVPQNSSLVPRSTFSAWASWAPGPAAQY